METQKELLIDKISPVIKQISPKWGDTIITILKSLDISKLLPLAQNDQELEKKVKNEEERLEKEERDKQERIRKLAEDKKRLNAERKRPEVIDGDTRPKQIDLD